MKADGWMRVVGGKLLRFWRRILRKIRRGMMMVRLLFHFPIPSLYAFLVLGVRYLGREGGIGQLREGRGLIDADDIDHMRRVVSYCKRHLAQEEKAKQDTNSKSYKSLKNWGHDALKAWFFYSRPDKWMETAPKTPYRMTNELEWDTPPRHPTPLLDFNTIWPQPLR
jgi:Protein of unknown function (DUF3140)